VSYFGNGPERCPWWFSEWRCFDNLSNYKAGPVATMRLPRQKWSLWLENIIIYLNSISLLSLFNPIDYTVLSLSVINGCFLVSHFVSCSLTGFTGYFLVSNLALILGPFLSLLAVSCHFHKGLKFGFLLRLYLYH